MDKIFTSCHLREPKWQAYYWAARRGVGSSGFRRFNHVNLAIMAATGSLTCCPKRYMIGYYCWDRMAVVLWLWFGHVTCVCWCFFYNIKFVVYELRNLSPNVCLKLYKNMSCEHYKIILVKETRSWLGDEMNDKKVRQANWKTSFK